jgi:hypothetical protein
MIEKVCLNVGQTEMTSTFIVPHDIVVKSTRLINHILRKAFRHKNKDKKSHNVKLSDFHIFSLIGQIFAVMKLVQYNSTKSRSQKETRSIYGCWSCLNHL